jgi:hypothetical protein
MGTTMKTIIESVKETFFSLRVEDDRDDNLNYVVKEFYYFYLGVFQDCLRNLARPPGFPFFINFFV